LIQRFVWLVSFLVLILSVTPSWAEEHWHGDRRGYEHEEHERHHRDEWGRWIPYVVPYVEPRPTCFYDRWHRWVCD
jgi:hypothetical protein